MRIVMLGHSNAGKTTYIAMMYQFMNKGKGHKGFHIQARDSRQHSELLENAQAINSGRYPPATSRRDAYEFDLSYEGRPVSRFIWSDYRGGALAERSTNEDMAALMADVNSCDGVVVFADAYELATGPDSYRQVGRLTYLMQRAIGERRASTPIVLAYTKADLIKSSEDWSKAIQPFSQVSAALVGSSNVKGAIVTVSCGRRPKAVHVPVLWCLTHGVANMIKELQDEADDFQRQAAAARKNGSIANSFTSWRDGVESERKKAARFQGESQAKLRELKPLQTPARELAKTLSKAQHKDGPPRAFRKASEH
jgi:hypothetical protein